VLCSRVGSRDRVTVRCGYNSVKAGPSAGSYGVNTLY